MRLRFILCLVFGLVGCQAQPQPLTPHYLMTHPTLLKSKAAECEQQGEENSNPDCPMITKTLDAFFALLLDQQREPEAFGKRILAAQQTYGRALAQVALTEQALSLKKASGADAKAEALAYQNALTAADEAKAKVDVMLVVVGESSPE
ncbi:MAG TPA: EexN family lipoprotein [Gammaproteobacteria bacterium]|nr:EexN family lipoprotein [Gammaproteobacteria bacterium]